MARINDLIRQLEQKDLALADEISREIRALSERRAFGLNFERHTPEQVELPGREVRKGDKVHILPPRGEFPKRENKSIWHVLSISKGKSPVAELVAMRDLEHVVEVAVEDLVVVAEFRDPIYPGLVSTGKVERGGDKPFHTVINGENFHALEALLFTHRGKVDAIYIDPPYNTGARDWKYNNDYVESDDLYRHSKWLAFIERRLLLAKELLNPADSVLIVTIDEKEYLRLGLLLEQTFPDARIQMISSQINPAAVAQKSSFGRSDEYLFIAKIGLAAPDRVPLSREWVSSRGRTHTGKARWDMLRRSGTNTERTHSPGCFYPVYVDPNGPKIGLVGEPLPKGQSSPEPVDGLVPVLPIRRDGSEGVWQWASDTFRARLAQGRVRVTGNESRGFVLSILKDGEYQKIVDGEFEISGYGPDGSIQVNERESESVLAIPGTQWRITSHDATQYGTRLLMEILPGRKFPFPKSLYAVEDVLRFFVANKPNAVVLDFFAGSGTTANAVMRLNKQDGGRRRSISVTNNEVAEAEQKALVEAKLRPGDPEWDRWGICDYITKPRVLAVVTGETPEGDPIKGSYKFTDVFPISDGFDENVEFLTLSYQSPTEVITGRAFGRIAPLLWMRAGSVGRRVDSIDSGWDVADSYGVITDLDKSGEFAAALSSSPSVKYAFVFTDEDRLFETISRQLPAHVEIVRMYDAYIRNAEIEAPAVSR